MTARAEAGEGASAVDSAADSAAVLPVATHAAEQPADGLALWMNQQGQRVELALEAVLPALGQARPGLGGGGLLDAMRYAVLGGGKRVRPLLVYAAGEISGAAPDVLDAAACAVELIHAYSLVHDDMPCMDDDELRRGKPTVHKKYGEALAMLVGDALQALAFEALVAPLRAVPLRASGGDGRTPVPVAEMVSVLAAAAGSAGMAGGQALDLGAVGARLDRQQLETMHQLKTGAMLAASVHLGLLGGGVLSPAMAGAAAAYSEAVGLAFQVVDDILDVTGDSKTLGKTAGKDQAQDKPTYVSILGLEESQALARQLGRRARQALEPFGGRASRLADLADFIVHRVH
jgi:farnesyl diphosphate synthase